MLKKQYPHIAAIAVFIIISAIYFNPVFDGKTIYQGDIVNFSGMSKEIQDFREKTGEEPLWTNSMFGGMPAYQISVLYNGNLIRFADKIITLGLPHPINLVFLYFLGFYLLLICMRVNPWLSIAGALAFGFSSYFFIIIEAGHNSKAHAIGYMAPVIAGIIYTYRGHLLSGGIFTSLALALQLYANHLQITYYLMLFVLIYFVFKAYEAYKEKQIKLFAKATSVLAIAAVFALLTNITSIWATYEYGKYTTRGKSELTIDKENQTSGLDKDYATAWSYGIGETMSLMIPDFKGGGSGQIGSDKDALKKIDSQYKQAVGSMDRYWGDQPFTSGPVYAGAIIVFLFVLGLFIFQGIFRWVLLTATLLSIMLAWGNNMMWFTDIFLDYFPGYNKFRAVSMTLVIAELTIPLLAILTLNKIFSEPEIIKTQKKPFLIALGLTAGLCLAFFLTPDLLTDFHKANEHEQLFSQIKSSNQNVSDEQITQYLNSILPLTAEARKNILTTDAFRSFSFIALAALLIWLFSKKTINKPVFISGIILLIVIDMAKVDYRYLNKDNFVNASKMEVPHQPNKADLQILQDTDPNFRVFNTLSRLDQDSRNSYFHKSLGGYHGAKLKRYQELIDFHLGRRKMEIINMLNAKYVIIQGEDGQPVARRNPGALGNAWFINEIKLVANADSEITAMSSFNPATTVIIDKRFEAYVSGLTISSTDSSASIQLESYKPNHLVYNSQTNIEQFAVFSEIYYDKGWNAYIDGNKSEYIRVNYVLRGMRIPAGNHKIEFRFEPAVFNIGEKISLASSLILILLFLFVLGKNGKEFFLEKA